MNRARCSGVSGRMRPWLAFVVLLGCMGGQEPEAPDDPEQRAIERVLSTPASAPAASGVALSDDFPWLADLVAPSGSSDPEAGLADGDLAAQHLSLAVHGDGHDARVHLKEAIAAFDRMRARDEGLFGRFLALLLQGDAPAWREAALELVRDAPMDPGIPYVYLAFGEIALDAGKPEDAVRFLDRALTFDDAHARAFAYHDLGWAHLQSSPPNDQAALHAFMRAIEESQRPEPKLTRSGAALRIAARRDLVVPYAAVGRPDTARDFFTRVGRGPGEEDMVEEMLRLLAAKQK
jgi:tetratricopeptide (TPR) repeat protein